VSIKCKADSAPLKAAIRQHEIRLHEQMKYIMCKRLWADYSRKGRLDLSRFGLAVRGECLRFEMKTEGAK